MNPSQTRKHSSDSLFMILLFGVFVVFLLMLLLFSARAYQTAVNGTEENYGIRTAMSYVTTKVHQHDSEDLIFISEVDGLPALCLKDHIEERDFITYIFLDEGSLKELYTSSDRLPVKEMGTILCPMKEFEISLLENQLYHISFTDFSERKGELYLHSGAPAEGGAL